MSPFYFNLLTMSLASLATWCLTGRSARYWKGLAKGLRRDLGTAWDELNDHDRRLDVLHDCLEDAFPEWNPKDPITGIMAIAHIARTALQSDDSNTSSELLRQAADEYEANDFARRLEQRHRVEAEGRLKSARACAAAGHSYYVADGKVPENFFPMMFTTLGLDENGELKQDG